MAKTFEEVVETLKRLGSESLRKGCIFPYAAEWIAAGIKLREKRKG